MNSRSQFMKYSLPLIRKSNQFLEPDDGSMNVDFSEVDPEQKVHKGPSICLCCAVPPALPVLPVCPPPVPSCAGCCAANCVWIPEVIPAVDPFSNSSFFPSPDGLRAAAHSVRAGGTHICTFAHIYKYTYKEPCCGSLK